MYVLLVLSTFMSFSHSSYYDHPVCSTSGQIFNIFKNLEIFAQWPTMELAAVNILNVGFMQFLIEAEQEFNEMVEPWVSIF